MNIFLYNDLSNFTHYDSSDKFSPTSKCHFYGVYIRNSKLFWNRTSFRHVNNLHMPPCAVSTQCHCAIFLLGESTLLPVQWWNQSVTPRSGRVHIFKPVAALNSVCGSVYLVSTAELVFKREVRTGVELQLGSKFLFQAFNLSQVSALRRQNLNSSHLLSQLHAPKPALQKTGNNCSASCVDSR